LARCGRPARPRAPEPACLPFAACLCAGQKADRSEFPEVSRALEKVALEKGLQVGLRLSWAGALGLAGALALSWRLVAAGGGWWRLGAACMVHLVGLALPAVQIR
jgi:hypothetical protein